MHRARMSTLKKTPDTVSVTADCSDLEGLVGYNLKRAYVIVQSDFRHALGKDGLSARSFSALSLVNDSELKTLLQLLKKVRQCEG